MGATAKVAILTFLVLIAVGLVVYGIMIHGNAAKNTEQDVTLGDHGRRLSSIENDPEKFRGPKGNAGPAGPTGPAGPAGSQGTPGTAGASGVCQSTQPGQPCLEPPPQPRRVATSGMKCPPRTKLRCKIVDGQCQMYCLKIIRKKVPAPAAVAQPTEVRIIREVNIIPPEHGRYGQAPPTGQRYGSGYGNQQPGHGQRMTAQPAPGMPGFVEIELH